MFGIIGCALAGLQSFQKQLRIIGNNLANLQTTGYKSQRIRFYEGGGSDFKWSSLVTNNHAQGELSSTGSSSDMAIDGTGYFILSNGSARYYTRDGAFSIDGSGSLVSAQGHKVMGWMAESGQVNTSGSTMPISIPLQKQSRARATSTLMLTGNLDSSTHVYIPAHDQEPESGGIARVQTQVHDSLGNSHTLDLTFENLGNGNWSWKAELQEDDASTLSETQGIIKFDSDGVAQTPYPTMVLDPSGNAASGQKIELNLQGCTSLADESSVQAKDADGYAMGTLSSFTMARDGTITGTYSNGMTETIGRLALANFGNLDGLVNCGRNLWQASSAAGTPIINPPGQSGAGEIAPSSLEGSNVDLNEQLMQTMVAQRAFQANSRIISVTDSLLDTLINLKS